MPRLTDRQKAEIDKLAARGMSHLDIARRIPCSSGAVWYRLVDAPRRRDANLYTPEQDEIITREMEAEDGRTIMQRVKDIAVLIGRSQGSVHGRLTTLGLIGSVDAAPPASLGIWPDRARFDGPRMHTFKPSKIPPIFAIPYVEVMSHVGNAAAMCAEARNVERLRG